MQRSSRRRNADTETLKFTHSSPSYQIIAISPVTFSLILPDKRRDLNESSWISYAVILSVSHLRRYAFLKTNPFFFDGMI